LFIAIIQNRQINQHNRLFLLYFWPDSATGPLLDFARFMLVIHKDIENHNYLTLRRNPGYIVWRLSDNGKVIDVRASGKFDGNSGNISGRG